VTPDWEASSSMESLALRLALPARYRPLRHLANGGMASVWVAHDELLGRDVAVKLLAPQLAADDDARARFTREARAAARLSGHPHVVTVYDAGEHDGQAFLVMALYTGGTVAERLRERLPDPDRALRWIREAADGLDAAHAAGVVHRDVKPANLLLDERDRVAVGDFGIATAAWATSVTSTGLVLGTMAYLAPEQREGRAATAASDRYALGVVAHQLLTGARPADGRVDRALPAAAHAVLDRALQTDPSARPPNCRAFVADLERAVGDADERTAVVGVSQRTRITGRRGGSGAAAPGAGPALSPRSPRPEGRQTPARTSATAATPNGPGSSRPDGRHTPARTSATAATPGAAADPGAAGSSRPDGRHTPARTSATAATPGAAGSPRPDGRHTPARTSATRPDRRRGALPAALALTATLALIGGAAAAIVGSGGDDAKTAGAGTSAERTTAKAQTAATAAATPAPTATPTPTAKSPAPAPVDDPKRLNDAGFALFSDGRYAEALPLLERAVAGLAATPRDIYYAYALYNLGATLHRLGRSVAAIPYLEKRLQISDFKRGVVQRELRDAQRAVGVAPSKPGKGKGRKQDD